MLTLPDILTIKRNVTSENEWVEKAREIIMSGEREEGIHASDLLDPRQYYWKRKHPLPLDDKSVMFFLIGRIQHEIEVQYRTGAKGEMDEGSHYHKELGIWYSPDGKLTLRDGSVIPEEYKTTRSKVDPRTLAAVKNSYGSYLEQLQVYMACMGVTKGSLKVLLISNQPEGETYTVPVIRVYRYEITDKFLQRIKKEIKSTVKLMNEAVKQDDHRKLPLCRYFKCSKSMCGWWDMCLPEGRHPDAPKPTRKPIVPKKKRAKSVKLEHV